MTDNDKAAVDALCSIHADGCRTEAGARAILDAIRAGKAPGFYCGALYDAQLQANAELRAEVERLREESARKTCDLIDQTKMTVAEKARADKAEKRLADYDARLTAVMAPDLKCWHQNSRDEWPEVAAWVINNLRQQIEVEKDRADKAEVENEEWRSRLERLTKPAMRWTCGQHCPLLDTEKARADKAVAAAAYWEREKEKGYKLANDAEEQRDRLADALRAVTDAYRFRFDVPGRGLCGPIDSEIEAAVAALAEALIAKVPLADKENGDDADAIGLEIARSADRYASDMVRLRNNRIYAEHRNAALAEVGK